MYEFFLFSITNLSSHATNSCLSPGTFKVVPQIQEHSILGLMSEIISNLKNVYALRNKNVLLLNFWKRKKDHEKEKLFSKLPIDKTGKY